MDNNLTSVQSHIEYITCLICWEKISSSIVTKCFICNILLHNDCEKIYRGEKGYCKCPHCQRIGTITCLEIGKPC